MKKVFFIWILIVSNTSVAEISKIRVLIQSSNQLKISAERIRILNTDSLAPYPELKSPAILTSKSQFQWPLQLLVENGSINGKPVSDFVVIQKNQIELDVILRVPLEKYLVGVLAKEVPAFWPIESLKAQAIASRSYAISQINQNNSVGEYDLKSDVTDQVFEFQDEKKADLVKINEAIKSTTGVVLLDQDKVAQAFFHADCGGVTVNPKSVWGTEAQKIVAVDPSCRSNPQTWEFRTSGDKLPLVKQNIGLSRHTEVVNLSANEIRKSFGFDMIKSAWFSVTKSGSDLIFKGRGRGHGVGLCQTGAMKWAQAGWSSTQILKHYYPEFQVTQTKK